jgi:hypothetical protein
MKISLTAKKSGSAQEIIKVLSKSTDPLERLIVSMSKSEKRYFRITSRFSDRKDSTCLKLFDSLAHGGSIRPIKHLPVTRHNLFKMIVRSLANFHNQRSGFGKLSAGFEELSILYQRGLYDSCRKQIDKSIADSIAIESFSLALEFLALKRKVIIATSPEDESALKKIGQQEFAVIQQITITTAYWTSMISLREEDPTLRSIPTKQLPVQAQILRLHGEFTRHYVGGDTVNAAAAIEKLVKLIELNPQVPGNDARPYLVALSNQLELHIHLRKWNSINGLLKKISAVQSTLSTQVFTTHHIRLTLRIFNLELEYYRDTHQWDAAVELSKKIRPYLETDAIKIPTDYRLLFHYQFANIHFHKGEYTEALKLLNVIINGNFRKVRPDILLYSRLLNIVVHYELGNYTLLEYLTGNARRSLVRDRQLTTFQEKVITLISNLSQADRHQKVVLLREAQEYLEGKSEYLATALDYLDLRTWVADKLGTTKKIRIPFCLLC